MIFILYDARAHTDRDSAQILAAVRTEQEAREMPRQHGSLWVQFDSVSEELTNPVERHDLCH